MVTASWFVTALEARNNVVKDIAVHGEICAIEREILLAVQRGDYEVTVTSSNMTLVPMTSPEVFSVDPATNTLLVPNHGLVTGDQVTVSSTGQLPPPLITLCAYYVIRIDDDHIRLATTRANALAGVAIAIDISLGVTEITVTDAGSGYLVPPAVRTVGGTPTTAASLRSNLLTYGNLHSVSVNTPGSGFTDAPQVTVNAVGSGGAAGTASFKVVAVQVSSGGEGYNVGDLLYVFGGSGTQAVMRVTAASGGSVTSAAIQTAGVYQVLPSLMGALTVSSGTGAGCTLNLTMGIAAISVGSPGSLYTTSPLISITGGGGAGAQAIAQINGGTIANFLILNPGSGYTEQPTISLTSGSGATVAAQLQPTGVQLVNVVDAGSSFSTVPDVVLTSQGSDATAGVITMKVVSATLINSGVDYSQGDQLLVSGGASTQSCVIQVLTVTTHGQISSFNIINPGSYTSMPVLDSNNMLGGTGTGASFNIVMGVNTISVGTGGTGYVAPPVVLITGDGVDAQAVAEINAGAVSAIQVVSSGANYRSVPTVTLTSGSGATAIALLLPTTLGAIQVTNPGSGYLVPPLVTITGGGGEGATAFAVIDSGQVVDVVLSNLGSGYTQPPQIIIEGNATAQALLAPTGLEAVIVTNSGINYTASPSVGFSEGDATAQAVLVPTGIGRIYVTNQGSNYTWDPLLQFTGGAGQQGAFVPPTTKCNRSFGVDTVTVVSTGAGYTSTPDVEFGLPSSGGTVATATATLGSGSGIFSLTVYAPSRDYYLVWKNLVPSTNMIVRPYADQISSVIKYFTDLGYTITQETNPATQNTFQWRVLW